MPISSNTLFHFTPKAEYLIDILKNEFQPRFCLEKINVGNKTTDIAFPMVCFCDIPLSQIRDHITTYGSYGIGMTKEWAKRNGLNPILYLDKDSNISQNFREIIEMMRFEPIRLFDELKSGGEAILKLIRYTKPYIGDFYRNGKIIKDVTFYNEREWRYVPPWDENSTFGLSKEQYDNAITLANENAKIKSYSLSFTPDDIKYIIVNNESEIYSMIESLKEIKIKYPRREIEILTSRIITRDGILSDF